MIKTTESRFSKLLGDSINELGYDTVQAIFTETGRMDGSLAKSNHQSIEDIYRKLNDFILDGMPCDTVNNIMENTPDLFRWKTPDKLHKPYWDANQLDVAVYYQLKKEYINAFIRAFDENLSYDYTETEGMMIHTITGGR